MNTPIESKGVTLHEANGGAGGKIATALIIGLIIGFAAGAFWQARRLAADSETVPTENIEEEVAALDDNEKKGESGLTAIVTETATGTGTSVRLVLRNQLAGSKVVVEEAVVEVPTWVAIREDQEGKPGNILGAQKVFPGVSRSIVVELLRPTVPNSKYHAVLYRDAGSPAFNYREEVLISNVESIFETKAEE